MKKIILLATFVLMLHPNQSMAVTCLACNVVPTGSATTNGTNNGNTVYNITAKVPPAGTASTCSQCFTNQSYETVQTCGPGTQLASTSAQRYHIDRSISGGMNGVMAVQKLNTTMSCAKCPYGSYNPNEFSVYPGGCTACPGGYLTTGSGATSCNTYKCTGFDYTASWETVTCDASSCTNVCKAKTCKAGAYLDNGVCKQCQSGTFMSVNDHTNTSCTSCSPYENLDCDATGLTWYRCKKGYYDSFYSGNTTPPTFCSLCPESDYYTTSALTTKARGTTSGITTKATAASCFLPDVTYYDAKGAFEFEETCYQNM